MSEEKTFSLSEYLDPKKYSAKERKQFLDAVVTEMNGRNAPSMFPTAMSASEHEAFKRAEREHAPGVRCRMNPNTFRVEYYDEKTGEIVSSHI